MSATLELFIASLCHAKWERKGFSIAGADFTYSEVVDLLKEIEALKEKRNENNV